MGHSATSLIAWPVRGQACQRTKRSCLTALPKDFVPPASRVCGRSRRAHGPIAWHQTIRKRGPRLCSGPIAWALRIARGTGSARDTRHRLGGAAVSRLVSAGSGAEGGGRKGQVVAIAPGFPGAASTSLREQVERAPPGQELVSACGSGPAGGGGHGRGSFRGGGGAGGGVVQVQPVVAVMAGAPFLGVGVRGVGWFRSSRWWRSWPGLLPAGGGAGGGVVQVQPVVAVTVAASLLWMRGSADD